MNVGALPGARACWALAALITLLLAGCTSTGAHAADAGRVPRSPLITTDSHGATAPATTAFVATTPGTRVTAVKRNPTPSTIGTSPIAQTGMSCVAVGALAFAALVPLLPVGTSHVPEQYYFCSDGRPLEVTFPATGNLAWTVTVTVTAGSAGDCERAAGGADLRCLPVPGHPGVVGTSAMCSAILCEQAWVNSRGYLVVVQASSQGRGGVGPGSGAPGSIGGTEIGVDVLAAITG